ncbi:MAG: tRNA (adenosine(37)-N6)-dimethylallyltransferase MiaA [Bacteroidales bacterium]
MGAQAEMITILGHTAGGKTLLAAHVAYELGGEVISADSRQVYRGMTIGTGKDYDDYEIEGGRIPFHLVDIVDAGMEYNVFEFQQDFYSVYRQLQEKHCLPVLCGGSGLYIESVLRQFDMIQVPVNESRRIELESMDADQLVKILASYGPLHNTTDTGTRKRMIRAIEIAEYARSSGSNQGVPPPIHCLNIGIQYERDVRRRRITERLKQRLEQGMVGEVEALLNSGVDHEKLEYYGLEYRFLSQYLKGELTYEEMFTGLNTAIHRFAKRQMTWFRGMERRGIEIHWLDGDLPLKEKVDKIKTLYSK